jgi:outer membrane immunogenic protein
MRVRRDGGTAIQSRFQSNVAFQQQIIIAGKSIMRVYGVRVRPERAEMKKLTVGLALASAFAGSVFAADLPDSMPVYAPRASVVPPLYSWTGCYIGPNVGGGWSGTTFKDATTLITLGTNNAASGVFGGGQVGCDYQYGWAVFGIRGMFDGIRATSNNIWPAQVAVNTTSLRWASTVTARLGIAPTPTLLVYLHGGALKIADDHTVQTPAGQALFTASPTRSGWTAGIGLEWGFAPNWSLFVEYSYGDFATETIGFNPVVPLALIPTAILIVTPGAAQGVFPINVRQDLNLLLVGVNYRFQLGQSYARY